MESPANSFIDFLREQLSVLVSPAVGLQLGIVIIAAAVAWLVRQRLRGAIAESATEPESSSRQIRAHIGRILLFPVVTLIGVLIGRSILLRTHWGVAALDIAIALLISLAAVRALVYLLQIALGPGRGLKTWESAIGTTIWALLALHLVGWLPELLAWMDELAVTLGATRISLLTLGKLAVSVAVWLLLALWLARTIEGRLTQSAHLDAGTLLGLAKFSKFLLLTLALLIALNSAGIDLTALTVFGGALGVGLGFGLQRIASNLICGFILIFERSIRPGDVLTVGNSFGEVRALHARYVVLRNRDGVETLIPNENLITSEVINWTYSDRNVRIKIPVQISYHDDPEQAMALMLNAATSNPRVLAAPTPGCQIMEFAENGINLELRAWIDDPEEGLGNVRSEVYLAIWRAFREHHITFPYPQRDVHIKTMPPRSESPS